MTGTDGCAVDGKSLATALRSATNLSRSVLFRVNYAYVAYRLSHQPALVLALAALVAHRALALALWQLAAGSRRLDGTYLIHTCKLTYILYTWLYA